PRTPRPPPPPSSTPSHRDGSAPPASDEPVFPGTAWSISWQRFSAGQPSSSPGPRHIGDVRQPVREPRVREEKVRKTIEIDDDTPVHRGSARKREHGSFGAPTDRARDVQPGSRLRPTGENERPQRLE